MALTTGDAGPTVEQLRALLTTRLMPRKVYTLQDWFGTTDFSLCRRHVDADGDARQDSVYLTVWKTWDFYFGIEEPLPRQGWSARLRRGLATLRHQPVPDTPQLQLLVRPYTLGRPGRWQALGPDSPGDAWPAALQAWRGVVDYVGQGSAQMQAGYPLWQQVQQLLTPQYIEAVASHPLFTETYNDWWDSERNGVWLGDLWVGARVAGMYRREPYPAALKLSWRQGSEAPGDAPDDAHAWLLAEVDAARAGPPQVILTHRQRQSASSEPLAPHAADHLTRLLSMLAQLQAQGLPSSEPQRKSS